MSTRELTAEQQEKLFLFIKSILDGAEAVGIKSIPLETETVRSLLAKLEYTLPRAAALDWLEEHEMEVARLGSGEGALWLKKGQTILEAVEARRNAEEE